MKILFFGLGSAGQRHFRLMHEMGMDHEYYAFRKKESTSDIPEGVRPVFSLSPNCADVAFICNWTNAHINTALVCARRGMHLFIEKPLDVSLAELDQLKKEVASRGLTAYVAYPLRFNEEVNKKIVQTAPAVPDHQVRIVCRSYLPNWRSGRRTYSERKATGGGALLELSHEIDLAQHLFGEIVGLEGELWRGGPSVTNDAEDEALLTATHYHKRKTSITLSINDQNGCRGVLIGPNDFIEYSASDDLYRRQLEYFFANIGNPRIMNNLDEAGKLLELILKVRE